MYEVLEEIFQNCVRYGILLLEVVGVIILLIAAVKALVDVVKNQTLKSKLQLAEGISTALSFLLCSEVMKTIIAPDLSEIGMTAAILLMRAGMSVLLHWEKKNEEEEERERG